MTERLTRFLRSTILALLIAPLRLYQWCVSPLLPHVCRFEPSCSHYALEALKTHGPGRGSVLAMKRLLRCHPFTRLGGSSGFDPVPPIR